MTNKKYQTQSPNVKVEMKLTNIQFHTSVNIVWLLLLSKLKFVEPTCLCSVVSKKKYIMNSETKFKQEQQITYMEESHP